MSTLELSETPRAADEPSPLLEREAGDLAVIEPASAAAEAASPGMPHARLPERRLVTMRVEPVWKTWLYLAVAIAVAAGYFVALHTYWAPAHPGVDQNGYLVGGRLFAETFSSGQKPVNLFQYYGTMWVMADDGWLFPKYPLGIPILTAACFWIGGESAGPTLAYFASPVCASLSLVAMFLLTRLIAGSFAGLIATLLLAANTILLSLTNNPNSHVPDLAFVLWGLLLLFWWWRYDGLRRAAAAGLLLGFAVMIRYTEGLLLLPMAVVALNKLRWRDARSYLRCATPLIAWMLPVGYLLLFNKLSMGTWTGYDSTNESTGFELATFTDNWRVTLDRLYESGAYFILPIGLLGLMLLWRASWRTAMFLTAWFVPGTLIYSSYYWGGDRPGMSYLRFFLTLVPPLLIGAAWLMTRLILILELAEPVAFEQEPTAFGQEPTASGGGRLNRFAALLAAAAGPIAIGLIVALYASSSLRETLPTLERDFVISTNLATATQMLKLHTRKTPPGDVVLIADSGGPGSAANHLQFATGYEMYANDAFTASPRRWLNRRNEPDAPDPVQPRRRDAVAAAYANLGDKELIEKQVAIIQSALSSGRRVILLLSANDMANFSRRFVQGKPLAMKTLATWTDPAKLTDIATVPLIAPRRGPDRQQNLQAPTPRNLQLVEIVRK